MVIKMTLLIRKKLWRSSLEVYAAEDIYTADFQKDDNGNRILSMLLGNW